MTDEPPLDPVAVERIQAYLEVTPLLAAALATLRMVVRHDLGPVKDIAVQGALEDADEILQRFQLIDPAGFAAVVGTDQEQVDKIRRKQGLGPEDFETGEGNADT
jgi:hypothetical protein